MRLSLLYKKNETLKPLGSGFVTNKKGLFITAAHVLKNHLEEENEIYAAFPDLESPCCLYKIRILYYEHFDPISATGPEGEKLKHLNYHQDLCIGRVLKYKSDQRLRINTNRPLESEILTVFAFHNPIRETYQIENGKADLTELVRVDEKFRIKHRELSIISDKDNDYQIPLDKVDKIKKYNNCLTLKLSTYPGTSGGAVLDEDGKVVGIVIGGKKDLHYSNVLRSKYIRRRFKRINNTRKTSMLHRQILTELSSLDLSTYPYDVVKSLLKSFGKFGIVVTKLHKGKKIIRARINDDKKHYTELSELSFKPQKYNKTYQRASTPNKTMFYGSIVPEIKGKSEPDTARATTLFEISDFVRDTETIGTQLITVSVWEVVEDISLISLVHYKKFERPTALSQKLNNEFLEFIKDYPELETQSIEIAEYLGEQYAKKVIPEENYNYLVSAIFSEIITEQGYDGVLYPSVKLAGEGINIAVKPEVINSKIKLFHAGECTVYKNGKNVFMGNDTYAEVDAEYKLSFVKAPVGVFVPYEYGIKQVGLDR